MAVQHLRSDFFKCIVIRSRTAGLPLITQLYISTENSHAVIRILTIISFQTLLNYAQLIIQQKDSLSTSNTNDSGHLKSVLTLLQLYRLRANTSLYKLVFTLSSSSVQKPKEHGSTYRQILLVCLSSISMVHTYQAKKITHRIDNKPGWSKPEHL